MRPAISSVPELLQAAVEYHRRGELDPAARLYRAVLARQPRQFDALHLLGVVTCATGAPADGVALIEAALAVNPGEPRALTNLANAYVLRGMPERASALLRAALGRRPQDRALRHALGLALLAAKDLAAGAVYAALAGEDGRDTVARARLGDTEMDAGQLAAAAASYRAALAVDPVLDFAWAGLARVHAALGEHDAARDAANRGLQHCPASSELWRALAAACKAAGNVAEQERCLARAVEVDPRSFESLLGLGLVRALGNDLRGAELLIRRALALRPTARAARVGLGNVLRELFRTEEALGIFRGLLAEAADDGEVLTYHGCALVDAGELAAAEQALDRALGVGPEREVTLAAAGRLAALKRDYPRALELLRRARRHATNPLALRIETLYYGLMLADWTDWHADLAATAAGLGTGQSDDGGLGNPFYALALPLSPATQLRVARHLGDALAASVDAPLPQRRPRAHERIRIGYLSADFRRHPVAMLVADTLARHARADFEVVALSYGAPDGQPHPARRRIIEACDRFIDLQAASIEQTAARIASEEIDIVVDLTGHTQGSRTRALAYRPAPLQISWLGYSGTTGCAFIDYFIADEWTVPEGADGGFVEKLIRLPDTFFPPDRSRRVDPPAERTACGLPPAGPVLCSFNQTFKIGPGLFASWLEILRGTPDATLWLAAMPAAAADNLRAAAAAGGVAPERIVFAARLDSDAAHLARYRLADLALDTYPYNSHTTASDALWAGCPLLTLSGDTFASRVAGSLLRAAHCPELVTRTPAEFAALGRTLAGDPARLATLRARLTANRDRAALFDAERFASHLDAAYRLAWERRLAGAPPAALRIAPDVPRR